MAGFYVLTRSHIRLTESSGKTISAQATEPYLAIFTPNALSFILSNYKLATLRRNSLLLAWLLPKQVDSQSLNISSSAPTSDSYSLQKLTMPSVSHARFHKLLHHEINVTFTSTAGVPSASLVVRQVVGWDLLPDCRLETPSETPGDDDLTRVRMNFDDFVLVSQRNRGACIVHVFLGPETASKEAIDAVFAINAQQSGSGQHLRLSFVSAHWSILKASQAGITVVVTWLF